MKDCINKGCEFWDGQHYYTETNCDQINEGALYKCKDYKPEQDELEEMLEIAEEKCNYNPYHAKLLKAIIDRIKKLENK